MINIKQFMSKPVVSITKDKTILDAAKLMAKKNLGCLVVVSPSKKPIGIVTDKDIIVKHVAKGKDPSKGKVNDIMTKKVISSPTKTTILKISQMMHEKKIKRVPIVEKGKAIGIITATDIAGLMAGKR